MKPPFATFNLTLSNARQEEGKAFVPAFGEEMLVISKTAAASKAHLSGSNCRLGAPLFASLIGATFGLVAHTLCRQ